MNIKGVWRSQSARALNLLRSPFIRLEYPQGEWIAKQDYTNIHFKEEITAYYKPMHAQFLNLFKARFKSPLLDVGCGRFYLYFKDFFIENCLEYRGIDPEINNIPNCRIGRGEHIPFENESFNSIMILTSLDHVLDADKTLSECCRVLAPGGGLFIIQTVFPDKNTRVHVGSEYVKAHMRIFTEESLKKTVSKARFKILECIKGFLDKQVYLYAEVVKTGKGI